MAWGIIDGVRNYGGLKGEHGVQHLMAPLHGKVFESEAAMRVFASTLVGGEGPDILVTDRLKKHRQGQFNVRDNLVQLRPEMNVGTLVHELAHYVQRCFDIGRSQELGLGYTHWSQAHGKVFKEALRQVATKALKLTGLEPEAAAKPARLRRGQRVRIKDKDVPAVLLVPARRSGWWIAVADDGHRYQAHWVQLVPL
jgi:hypothetical protein